MLFRGASVLVALTEGISVTIVEIIKGCVVIFAVVVLKSSDILKSVHLTSYST